METAGLIVFFYQAQLPQVTIESSLLVAVIGAAITLVVVFFNSLRLAVPGIVRSLESVIASFARRREENVKTQAHFNQLLEDERAARKEDRVYFQQEIDAVKQQIHSEHLRYESDITRRIQENGALRADLQNMIEQYGRQGEENTLLRQQLKAAESIAADAIAARDAAFQTRDAALKQVGERDATIKKRDATIQTLNTKIKTMESEMKAMRERLNVLETAEAKRAPPPVDTPGNGDAAQNE